MFSRKNKGQVTGLIGAFIGIMIALIIGVAVVIPTVQDSITTLNATGTLGTILDQIPLLLGVALLLLVVGLLAVRGFG